MHQVNCLPRIVMLAERLRGGGAERLTVQLAIAASRRGHAVTVIATAEQSAQHIIDRLRREDVTVFAFSLRGPKLWIALVRLVRGGGFDLLHSQAHLSNWRGAVVSTLVRVPICVATEHSWSYRGRLLRRLRDRYIIASRAKVLVAVSEADRKALAEIEKIPLLRLAVIPNGVEAQSDPHDSDENLLPAVKSMRYTARPLIGTVCYLRRQKALHVLIQAVVLLRRDLPGVELVVVGDGPLRGELSQLIADLDASEFIHLLGHSDNPRSLLPHIDIFALSSAFEGAPFSLLDAMAERRPIVATAVGGVPELVPHRFASLLVNPGSPAEMALALLELARDGDLRERVAAGAADRVKLFSLAESANHWFDLYDSLWLAQRRRRGRG